MGQTRKLIRANNHLHQQNNELIMFLAVLVNRSNNEVSIPVTDFESIKEKTFKVDKEGDVITIKLV